MYYIQHAATAGKHVFLPVFVFFAIMFSANSVALRAQDTLQQQHQDTLFKDAAVLWRGFTHQWSYNHRLNRLGSYIENPPEFTGFPFTATFNHTSATGVGPDVGVYNGFYSYIAANGVAIQSGKKSIQFSGKLGDMHAAVFEVFVDAKKAYTIQDHHTVVINGFDIVSERRADKLQMLRLSVSNGDYIPATGQIRFTVNAALLVRCQSIECNLLSDRFEYTINLDFLIFSAPEQSLFPTELSCHRVYNWDKHAEIQNYVHNEYGISGVGNDLYPTAALAFKSINIILDRPHWYVEWHSAIQPLRYNSQLGSYRFNLDLLFKQWTSDMRKDSAYPSKSKFAFKRNGWAAIDGTVVMLQFASGFVINNSSKGAFKWEGKNQPANTSGAIVSQNIVFDTDVFLKDLNQFRKGRILEEERAEQLYKQYISDLAKLKEQRKQEKEQKKQQKKNTPDDVK